MLLWGIPGCIYGREVYVIATSTTAFGFNLTHTGTMFADHVIGVISKSFIIIYLSKYVIGDFDRADIWTSHSNICQMRDSHEKDQGPDSI